MKYNAWKGDSEAKSEASESHQSINKSIIISIHDATRDHGEDPMLESLLILPSCQLSQWKETGVFGENPQLYDFRF